MGTGSRKFSSQTSISLLDPKGVEPNLEEEGPAEPWTGDEGALKVRAHVGSTVARVRGWLRHVPRGSLACKWH